MTYGRSTPIRVPAPCRESTERLPPSRAARVAMPVNPRCPGGTAAGSKPRPSSEVTMKHRPSDGGDGDPDVFRRRMLDDVVEGLLGDPEERLLDRWRHPLDGPGVDGRRPAPVRASTAATWVRRATTRPSRVRPSGRSSKMSARISARASRWRTRRSANFVARGGQILVHEQLEAPGHQRHREERLCHRVMELTREMGTLVRCRQRRRLVAQLLLQPEPFPDLTRDAREAAQPAAVDVGLRVQLDRDPTTIGSQDPDLRPDRQRTDRRPARRTAGRPSAARQAAPGR